MSRRCVLFLLMLILGCEAAPPSGKPPQVPRIESPTPTPTAVCAKDQLLLVPSTDGAGGSAIIGVEIHHRGDPCTFRGEAELRILDAEGSLLEAQGNPSKATIELSFPSDHMGVMWSWQNWCGPAVPIRFVISIGGLKTSLESIAGPRCDMPGISILQFLF